MDEVSAFPVDFVDPRLDIFLYYFTNEMRLDPKNRSLQLGNVVHEKSERILCARYWFYFQYYLHWIYILIYICYITS